MPYMYVNAVTGNNSNSGATPALAKLTIAGAMSAATAGDILRLTGSFNEALAITKNVNVEAYGFAEINGNGVLASLITGAGTIAKISGLVFRNAAAQIGQLSTSGYWLFQNCILHSAPTGIAQTGGGAGQVTYEFENCSFYNFSVRAVDLTIQIFWARNCVFANSPEHIKHTSSSPYVRLRQCVFADNTFFNLGAAATLHPASDFNAYNFSAGKAIIAGVDQTSLATLRTTLSSNREMASVDQSLSLCDEAKHMLRPLPSANLLTQGPMGEPIGLAYPGYCLSSNRNSSLWTGGNFTNCEINGSGNLVLSAGQTVGTYQSDVIDLGAAIYISRINLFLTAEGYTNQYPYVDYATAEATHQRTIRVRASNSSFGKSDGSPSWVEVPRNAVLWDYGFNALRYWQVELTLRSA